MSDQLRLGIAGLGTVGMGVVDILQKSTNLLAMRSDKELVLTAVSARDRSKDRGADLLNGVAWYDDALRLADDDQVDVVVELIGGDSGVALELCHNALKNGKHVVTANKALIAHHGSELATLAQQQGVALAFEAAVAGGIPIIKCLKEGLVANQVIKVLGILNGTCNYILTAMQETGRDFSAILSDAQELGYAEADPSFDVDGIDTAHKIAILSSIAFGAGVHFDDDMYIQGITDVSLADIAYASELGYVIKLLGVADIHDGNVGQYVYPALVSHDHPLAQVNGVDNAVFVEGDAVGKVMARGPGAGRLATASSVVADIVDIASGRHSYPFGIAINSQSDLAFADISEHEGEYYLRIDVEDQTGVLADITDVLRDEGVSMDSIMQKSSKEGDYVHVIGKTHHTNEKKIIKTVEKIDKVARVLRRPVVLRIESAK